MSLPIEILRTLIRDHWPARALAMACHELRRYGMSEPISRFAPETTARVAAGCNFMDFSLSILPNGVMHGRSRVSIPGERYFIRAKYHLGEIISLKWADYGINCSSKRCVGDPRIVVTWKMDHTSTMRNYLQVETPDNVYYLHLNNFHGLTPSYKSVTVCEFSPQDASFSFPLKDIIVSGYDFERPMLWIAPILAKIGVSDADIIQSKICISTITAFGAFYYRADIVNQYMPGTLHLRS